MSDRILIVGGDGQIGAALGAAYRGGRSPVTTTSRRPSSSADSLQLDLADLPADWQPPDDVGAAIITAAITSTASCRDDPAGTSRVNVDGVLDTARHLLARGAFVVFPSTNLVFDGSQPMRPVDDAVCPVTEYGRQKAEVEAALLAESDRVAVVRLTKVIGPEFGLLDGWATKLAAGQTVHAFRDAGIAPIPMSTVVSTIQLIVARGTGGLHHLSGERDVSYAEVAERLCRAVGAPTNLVQPTSWRDAAHLAEPMPEYTTLDVGALEDRFGIRLPSTTDTIEAAIRRSITPRSNAA